MTQEVLMVYLAVFDARLIGQCVNGFLEIHKSD
jgi:hypothetical protein